MINSIEITNYLGEKLVMDLVNPEKSGFAIMSIEGLGPAEANINITDIATADGGLFNSSRLETRNITMKVRFLHPNSIETVRQLSYKYFPIKKELIFRINTDNRIAQIVGYVETNEPDIFSKEEEADISILCPNPYFVSINKDQTVFSGVTPLFEFPFENNSVSEKEIEMGRIEIKTYNEVPYSGDAEVGVTIVMHAVGTVRNVDIYNTLTREHLAIDTDKLEEKTGHPIINRDTITLVTKKNQKSITLLRDGVETNILNCINKDADWFQLAKGINIFAFTAEYGSTNLQFRVINDILYEGI